MTRSRQFVTLWIVGSVLMIPLAIFRAGFASGVLVALGAGLICAAVGAVLLLVGPGTSRQRMSRAIFATVVVAALAITGQLLKT